MLKEGSVLYYLDDCDFFVPPNYTDFMNFEVDGIHFGPNFEHVVADCLAENLRDMDTFVDIGACCGAYSVIAAKRTSGVIYAFEPCSDNFEYLKKNTETFANAHCKSVALWSYPDELTLKKGKDAGGSTISDECDNFLESEKVLGLPLDEFELDADIIKIDVEGNAVHVLKGGENTIKTARLIIIEIHDLIQGKFPTGEEKVADILRGWGFAIKQTLERQTIGNHIWTRTKGFIAEKEN